MEDYTGLMTFAGSAILAIGVAWGGTKVALNGTKDRIKTLEIKSDDHIERLVRIESKVDILLEKK